MRVTLAAVAVLVCLLLLPLRQALAAQAMPAESGITVDIPVTLKSAKILFDVSHPAFAGDVPVVLKYMNLMSRVFTATGTKWTIIGVFYAEAAYFVLDDPAYNARRGVASGNPYKPMIAKLQAAGVQFEICANAMEEQRIRNADLIPGVKANAGANFRMVQLMQEGFARLQP